MSRLAEWRRMVDWQHQRLRRWWHRRAPLLELDAGIRNAVETADGDADALSRALVDYLWRAHLHYRQPDGTLAYYPGWPSIYGATNDAIEGVTRLMPLWAAYGASPWAEPGRADAMRTALTETLRHGTDPAHPRYWGEIGDRSTLICEGADVALALWLGRAWLWPTLAPPLQQQVLRWLRQAVGRLTADNNWHLFVVTIDAVLAQLDPSHRFSSAERLARVQSFRVADGCYTDGPGGAVDLYNAWGFHYSLYWLAEMGIASKDGALSDFCRWYQWLFTPCGLPLFGRSLCYRHAASAPLLLGAARDPVAVAPGVALAAYLANWRSFTAAGGLRAGRPTQGVFGEDIRWLNPYSGPASSLWGARSLVAYFYTGRTIDWRSVQLQPLPASHTRSDMRVQGLSATIIAADSRGEVCLRFDGPDAVVHPFSGRTPLRGFLRQALLGMPSRPGNNLLKAGHRLFPSSNELYR